MDKPRLITQLHRLEGQLRGIETMIQTDRGLIATTQQLMAARSALKKITGNYIQLFISQKGDGNLELSQEQLDYLLRLIEA